MGPLVLVSLLVAMLTSPAPAAAVEPLDALLRPVAERVTTSNAVAAAKWGTGRPIDDPAREQQVLDAVASRSEELGIDPKESERVFRDQIEAGKLVQRALHERWSTHPDERPTDRPDLDEIRSTIDRLNDQILLQLRETQRLREQPACTGRLTGSVQRVRVELRLSTLHQFGLGRATRSICS